MMYFIITKSGRENAFGPKCKKKKVGILQYDMCVIILRQKLRLKKKVYK